MTTPARSLLETIRRRSALIESLHDSPFDKRELTERLDVSRQTVDRSIRELESSGVVERTPSGYQLTLFGSLAYREFDALLDRFERLQLVHDLLGHLSADTEFDVGILADAEVIRSGHPMPHEPIRKFGRAITSTDRIVGCSPVVFPRYVSLFHRRVVETDTEIELFLDTSLVEQLWANYDTELREALSEPNFTLYQCSDTAGPNLGISLLDDSSVWIGVYNTDGKLQGMITTDSERAIEWANARFERWRTQGREVTDSTLSDG